MPHGVRMISWSVLLIASVCWTNTTVAQTAAKVGRNRLRSPSTRGVPEIPWKSYSTQLASGQYFVVQSWPQEKKFARPYYVHVPKFEKSQPGEMPVIVFLHGNGGNAKDAMRGFLRRRKRIASRFILVFAQGYRESWNIVSERSKADDRRFVESIVQRLAKFDNVASSNFTVMGASNGAALVNQLAIESKLPNIRNYISGVSPLNVWQYDGKNFKSKGNDNNYRADAKPMTGKRLLNVSGTDDKLVPYRGGPSRVIPAKNGKLAFLDAEQSTFVWARHMGYKGERLLRPSRIEGNTEVFSYLRGDVMHCKLNNVGHGALSDISEDILLAFLQSEDRENSSDSEDRTSDVKPVVIVAEGLNADGSLVKYYRRGLNYAIEYFGNYGPYYIYLLGPVSEKSVRDIFRRRAASRVNPNSAISVDRQIGEFLTRPNVVAEIKAVMSGKSEGGLTWTQDSPLLYEDVTTNARGREKDPIENTWGALHEYHHVFQMAHCDTKQERTSDKNINSWIAEGMATYSSAKFMENLKLVDFKNYMLELRKSGGNIGRPGINEFLVKKENWQLQNENYWESGDSAQVYYMLGAWATAYLIHVQGVDEVTVLKDWFRDIPRLGKSAAFKKHMGISLEGFYVKFDTFIRQSDEKVMQIFQPQIKEK